MTKRRRSDPEESTAQYLNEHMRELRSRVRPKIISIEEAYDEKGLIRPEFIETDFEDKIQANHRKASRMALEVDWMGHKVPLGLREAMRLPLIHNQIIHKTPWGVMWTTTQHGQLVRKRIRTRTLMHATLRLLEQLPEHKSATVVSLCRGYDIPRQMRGRLPGSWRWCPQCMKPRRYKRVLELIPNWNLATEFQGQVKVWSSQYHRYEWRERRLALMLCPLCHGTNRDIIFRRSNQPWETIRVPAGRKRVVKRKKL